MATRNGETVKIKKLEYHRNGVAGEGFWVALAERSGPNQATFDNFVIIRFDDSNGHGGVLCAAFDVDMLANGNIAFGENSWRGDVYAPFIDEAIDAKNKKDREENDAALLARAITAPSGWMYIRNFSSKPHVTRSRDGGKSWNVFALDDAEAIPPADRAMIMAEWGI